MTDYANQNVTSPHVTLKLYVIVYDVISATQGSMTAEQLRNISEMGIIPPQQMLPVLAQSVHTNNPQVKLYSVHTFLHNCA